MSVLELQPTVNAVRGLPLVSGNQGVSDDRALVAKAKLGHHDAFEELYNRHQRKAYCTALRILRNQQDAEDAVQRGFQRALVNLRTVPRGLHFLDLAHPDRYQRSLDAAARAPQARPALWK